MKIIINCTMTIEWFEKYDQHDVPAECLTPEFRNVNTGINNTIDFREHIIYSEIVPNVGDKIYFDEATFPCIDTDFIVEEKLFNFGKEKYVWLSIIPETNN